MIHGQFTPTISIAVVVVVCDIIFVMMMMMVLAIMLFVVHHNVIQVLITATESVEFGLDPVGIQHMIASQNTEKIGHGGPVRRGGRLQLLLGGRNFVKINNLARILIVHLLQGQGALNVQGLRIKHEADPQ